MNNILKVLCLIFQYAFEILKHQQDLSKKIVYNKQLYKFSRVNFSVLKDLFPTLFIIIFLIIAKFICFPGEIT